MVRRILCLLVYSAICLGILTGCAKKPRPEDKVIAEVSSRKITLKEFRSKIAKIPAYYQTVVDKNKRRYLDELVMEMLLYEEAVRKGVGKEKEIRDILEEAKKKVVIAKFVKTEIDDKVTVKEDEIKKFYEEHKDEFKSPPMWRASHILVADEAKARDVAGELAKGRSLEELASAYSIDATSTRGGDVGYFKEGQLVPDFEKACLELKVGQTSGIVRTQFGYHIIKLTDKKESVVEDLGSPRVRPAIEAELKRRKKTELFDAMAARLRKKYNVKINDGIFESSDKALVGDGTSGGK